MTYAYASRCRWWSPPDPAHNNGPRPAWDPECPIGEPGPHREDVRRGAALRDSLAVASIHPCVLHAKGL